MTARKTAEILHVNRLQSFEFLLQLPAVYGII